MHLNIICFAAGLLSLPAWSKPVDDARRLYLEQIQPMFAERANHYDVKIESRARGALIRIESRVDGRRTGLYGIRLNDYTSDIPTGAPNVVPMARGEAHGELMLPLEWRRDPTQIQNLLRGLVRGDEALHPMNRPPGAKWRATPPQRHVLDQLHAGQVAAKAKGVGQRALVLAPPGFGKTKVAGMFTRELGQQDHLPQIIVYVIENRDVLDKSLKGLAEVRNFSNEKIRRAYGAGSPDPLFGRGATLIGASRTVTHRELPSFLRSTKNFRGRIIYVFDECQHIGKVDGQFGEILQKLDRGLRARDILLGLTATPWHTDTGAIHKFFHDQIVTTHITPESLQNHLTEDRLIELSRLVMFGHMAAGWLPPIYSYQQIEYVDPVTETPTRGFLNDYEIKTLIPADAPDRREKVVRVHRAFVDRILEEIRGTFQKVNGEPVYFNRGIIFVPSILHAEEYARILNERRGPGEKIEARAYHSNLSRTQRDVELAWFEDHASEHKYLIAIRTIGEGFDEPRVNHIVLAKPYSEIDPIGMRELLQNLGRLTRIAHGKWRTFISDFTGDMRRLLFKDLDQNLVRAIFVDGGRIDMRELPMTRVPSVDKTSLRQDRFVTEDVPVDLPALADSRKHSKPWTLARLLADGRVLGAIMPQSHFAGEFKSIGEILCNERGTLDLRLALNVLAAYDVEVDSSFGVMCGRGFFEPLVILNAKAAVKSADALEAALLEFSRDHFGRRLRLKDSHINQYNLPLADSQPTSAATEDPWQRRWTLAELMLHPLLMPIVLNHLSAPNLARALLDETGVYGAARQELRQYVGDFVESAEFDVLRQAASIGLIPPSESTDAYDLKRVDHMIRNLTAFAPGLFGRATNMTDAFLFNRAKRDREEFGRPPARLRGLAHSHFLLKKLPARRAGSLPSSALNRWLDPPTRTPTEATRVVGDAPVTEKSLAQFTERRLFAALNSAEALDDDVLYERMVAYVRERGPWRVNLGKPSPETAVRRSEPTADGWTLARVLLHPHVLASVYREPRFIKAVSSTNRFTLGHHICRQVNKTYHGLESMSVEAERFLVGLDLDYARWRQIGFASAIELACAQKFFRFTGQRADDILPRLDELERRLIALSPKIFGLRTYLTDADLAADVSILARLPLVPEFARPPEPERWTAPWSLAQMLASEELTAVLYDEFSSLMPRVMDRTFPLEDFAPGRSAVIHGFLGMIYKRGDEDRFHRTDHIRQSRGTEDFLALGERFMGTPVDMSFAKLHALATRPGVSRDVRNYVEAFLISRRLKIPPATPVVSDPAAPTRPPADAPWTLARLLLHPDVLTHIYRSPEFSNQMSRGNRFSLGHHVCREVKKSSHGLTTKTQIARQILTGLDLDFTRWQQLGFAAAIEAACAAGVFEFLGKRLSDAVYAELDGRESTLIALAPEVFGRPTNISESDLAADRFLMSKMPLVADFARAPDLERWTEAWSIAELITNPLLPKLLFGPAAHPLIKYLRSGQYTIGGIESTNLAEITELLVKRLSYTEGGDSHELDSIESDYSSYRLSTARRSFTTRRVDMSFAKFYALSRRPSVAAEIRADVDALLISRGMKVPPGFECDEEFTHAAELP